MQQTYTLTMLDITQHLERLPSEATVGYGHTGYRLLAEMTLSAKYPTHTWRVGYGIADGSWNGIHYGEDAVIYLTEDVCAFLGRYDNVVPNGVAVTKARYLQAVQE